MWVERHTILSMALVDLQSDAKPRSQALSAKYLDSFLFPLGSQSWAWCYLPNSSVASIINQVHIPHNYDLARGAT